MTAQSLCLFYCYILGEQPWGEFNVSCGSGLSYNCFAPACTALGVTFPVLGASSRFYLNIYCVYMPGHVSIAPVEPTRTLACSCSACSKTRGIGSARKLRILRRNNRWADKKYKKSHQGNEWKKPFAGASHAKGIVLEKL